MNALPPNFPPSSEMRDPTDYYKVLGFYRRFVEEFYMEYRFGHFLLAAYAAVPAQLTPDLLYKIWQNFGRYIWNGQSTAIHSVAVSDILLSPLCREVGTELYEMVPSIRTAFLTWLVAETQISVGKEPQFKPPQEVAQFLLEYHQKPNEGVARWGNNYEEAQTWNALSFVNPNKVQQELWDKLEKLQKTKDNKPPNKTEQLRVLDAWSKAAQRIKIVYGETATQTLDFAQNNQLVSIYKALIQQNTSVSARALQLKNKDNSFDLYDFLYDKQDKPADAIEVEIPLNANDARAKMAVVHALIVGIDKYESPKIKTLNGSKNDALRFQDFLEEYCKNNGKTLDIKTYLESDATYANVNAALETFKKARGGDLCLFYYAGHANIHGGERGSAYSQSNIPNSIRTEGRELILYDYKTNDDSSKCTQLTIEQKIYDIIAEKAIHSVLIFDADEATTEARTDLLALSPIRKTNNILRGSLIIMNACGINELAKETTINGKEHGIFSYNLLDTLRNSGTRISYRQLMQRLQLRQRDQADKQTPYLEAFPASVAEDTFLVNRIAFSVRFDKEQGKWLLNAGAVHGITPSLNFMRTTLKIEDDTPIKIEEKEEVEQKSDKAKTPQTEQALRKIEVEQVFPTYSTIYNGANLFSKEEENKTFRATLLQTALPKIKVAYHPSVNTQLKQRLAEAIKQHDIYYIDILETEQEAHFLIRTQENGYFLTRSNSQNTTKPLFQVESEPFEFIKQMEFIAQWYGVLEYDNPSSQLKRSDVSLTFEIVEGVSLRSSNLDSLKATQMLENPNELSLNYVDNYQPALRCRIESMTDEKPLFINFLYLGSQFGIMQYNSFELPKKSSYSHLTFKENGQVYITIPLNIDREYEKMGINEVYDYLKVFISDNAIETNPLSQVDLEFGAYKTTTRGSTYEERKGHNIFSLDGADWISITTPIKIAREQEGKPQETKKKETKQQAKEPKAKQQEVKQQATKSEETQEHSLKKILFLNADPFNTGELNLKQEYAEIARQFQSKKDVFNIKSEFCTDLESFQMKINAFRPNIIHFAGHGSDSNGELEAFSRGVGFSDADWKENTGLIFHESGYGAAALISDDTLDYNFETFIEADKIPIEVIVLNACYSTNQANILSKRVKYVVGVHNNITDGAGIDFSAGFYYALSDGKSVESAFRYGKGRAIAKLKDRNQIVLYVDGAIALSDDNSKVQDKSIVGKFMQKEVKVACVSKTAAVAWDKYAKSRAELLGTALIKPVGAAENPDYVLNTEGGKIFIADPRVAARPLVKMIDNNGDAAFDALAAQLGNVTRWAFAKAQKSNAASDSLFDNISISFEHEGKSDDLKKLSKATCRIAKYKTYEPKELYGWDELSSVKITNNSNSTIYISGMLLSEFFGIDCSVINENSIAAPLEAGKTTYMYQKTFRFTFRDHVFYDKWDKFSNYLKIYVSTSPFEITQFQQPDLERPRKGETRGDEASRGAIREPEETVSPPQWAVKTIEFEIDTSSLV